MVHSETVGAFATKFAAAGLQRGACYPCLGMAENGRIPQLAACWGLTGWRAAVYVTGRGPALKEPTILKPDARALEGGVVELGTEGPSSQVAPCCVVS